MFYGPVLSRRFGYSLGVDLIPLKVCVYDCIYCQLGKTTNKTIERKKYVDINFEEFKDELTKKIKSYPYIDYITFSGSGEPTLNSDIGRLIAIAKENSNIPVAVLTSGGILSFDEVIDDISGADLIKVSLDATDDRMFKKINRPSKGINFDKNIKGLKKLMERFSGNIWLEIMLMEKVNDDLENAHKFKSVIESMGDNIEKIHLNTPVRSLEERMGRNPVKIPQMKRLNEIKKILGNKAKIIGEISRKKYNSNMAGIEKEIIELLKRRPVRIKEIAFSLGLNINEVIKFTGKLLDMGEIERVVRNDMEYYFKPGGSGI
ncbi:MAG: radical SAM protein [Actinomycetota bacterium]|nr:radical SAM protein [Actinomycetota bacterium]